MADITLAARLIRALQSGPINGQTAFMSDVLGPRRTIEQCEAFRMALRFHLVHPIGIVEERIQVPHTGVESAATTAWEYRYRLPTAAEAAASRAMVREPLDVDQTEWHEGAD